MPAKASPVSSNASGEAFATFSMPRRPLDKKLACFATDRITVDGCPVGYMYREPPDNDVDSGWRFLAGDESDEYMEDASNLALYDVDTIANHDPSIVPFLDESAGAAFERDDGGELVRVPGPNAN